MKKYILLSLLILSISTLFAIPVSDFAGWSELIQRSPHIVIAQCTTAFDITNPTNRVVVVDGMIPSNIEVISVLKGDTKPGPSHLASGYWPYAGQKLLIFADYENDRFYKGYNAAEDYRVVPLNHYFRTNLLDGKTLEQQILWILNDRLHDLNAELANGNEEKKRLEEGFPVVTNAAYRIQEEQAERKREEEEFKKQTK